MKQNNLTVSKQGWIRRTVVVGTTAISVLSAEVTTAPSHFMIHTEETYIIYYILGEIVMFMSLRIMM